MDPSQVDVPPLKDLTIDNITDNVKLINSQCPNPRLKYVLDRLVQHLHDFARETRLSHDEWMTGLLFLTSVGQICTDVRQVSSLPSPILPLVKNNHTIPLTFVVPGIHPPLRHPRPLPPNRLNLPPQTPQRPHRRNSPRPLPLPRSRNLPQRLPHLPRPRRNPPPRNLQSKNHHRLPHRRRKNRHLGNRLERFLRRPILLALRAGSTRCSTLR